MTMKRQWVIGLIVLLTLSGAWSALAQGPGSPAPNFPLSNFRFNFINPGSRATGMGQAFIAVGDDATGSETNPAGLTALLTPQVFIEGRLVRNIFHTLNPTDTEILYTDFPRNGFSPTFISLVYPFRNWAIGVYRQELANYSISISQPLVPIPGVHNILTPNPSQFFVYEFSAAIDIKVVNYGFSLARRWGERVNAGISVRASRFSFSSLEMQPVSNFKGSCYIPTGESEAIMERIQGDDWDVSWTAGFIVKPVKWLKAGGVYRSGSDHHFLAVFDENLYSALTHQSIRSEVPDFKIRVPSRFGTGVAVLPNDRLTFTADVVHIRYGEMTSPFVSYIQKEFQDDYGFEDGTSVRLGGEYTFFIRKTAVSLRAGYYSDPDNTLHFWGDRHSDDVANINGVILPISRVYDDFPRAQGALFPRRGTDHHATFGGGVTFKKHLQLEAAADLARERDYAVVSLLYNF